MGNVARAEGDVAGARIERGVADLERRHPLRGPRTSRPRGDARGGELPHQAGSVTSTIDISPPVCAAVSLVTARLPNHQRASPSSRGNRDRAQCRRLTRLLRHRFPLRGCRGTARHRRPRPPRPVATVFAAVPGATPRLRSALKVERSKNALMSCTVLGVRALRRQGSPHARR